MGKRLRTNSRGSLSIVVLLVFCIWGSGSHEWAYAESNTTTGAVGTLSTNSQEVSWIATDVKGQVGRPLLIHLNLSPYPPAPGTFYTALVDVLESPEGSIPEIVPGVPDISVLCLKPGIYRLRIRANLIEKSSCALTDAQILKEQEIRLTITQ
jgi:hypothetical protein